MTGGWVGSLNRLDFGLKRVEPCDGPSHADQINRLLCSRNFGLDGSSFGSHRFFRSSLNIQGRIAPPTSLRLTSASNIAREECVMVVPPQRTCLLTIHITRWNPAGFNQAGALERSATASVKTAFGVPHARECLVAPDQCVDHRGNNVQRDKHR
jgi:hypothetical protein